MREAFSKIYTEQWDMWSAKYTRNTVATWYDSQIT